MRPLAWATPDLTGLDGTFDRLDDPHVGEAFFAGGPGVAVFLDALGEMIHFPGDVVLFGEDDLWI